MLLVNNCSASSGLTKLMLGCYLRKGSTHGRHCLNESALSMQGHQKPCISTFNTGLYANTSQPFIGTYSLVAHLACFLRFQNVGRTRLHAHGTDGEIVGYFHEAWTCYGQK